MDSVSRIERALSSVRDSKQLFSEVNLNIAAHAWLRLYEAFFLTKKESGDTDSLTNYEQIKQTILEIGRLFQVIDWLSINRQRSYPEIDRIIETLDALSQLLVEYVEQVPQKPQQTFADFVKFVTSCRLLVEAESQEKRAAVQEEITLV